MADIVEVVQERLLTSYSKHVKQDKKQISPALIEMLLQLAASMLISCLKKSTPQEIKAKAKRPIIARASVKMAMGQLGYGLNRSDANEIVNSSIDTTNNSSSDEMTEFADRMNFTV